MKKFICSLAVVAFFCACSDDDDAAATIDGCVSENILGMRGEVTYLQGVTVELSGENVKARTCLTDARGRYSFVGLSTGAYRMAYTYADYTTVDTLIHIYKEATYDVNVTMKFNFDGADTEWVCDDLLLTLHNNIYTLKKNAFIISKGNYDTNETATLLTFTPSAADQISFEADYLGQGSLYVFTSEPIDGKERFLFYRK